MSYWIIKEFEDFHDKKGTPYKIFHMDGYLHLMAATKILS